MGPGWERTRLAPLRPLAQKTSQVALTQETVLPPRGWAGGAVAVGAPQDCSPALFLCSHQRGPHAH